MTWLLLKSPTVSLASNLRILISTKSSPHPELPCQVHFHDKVLISHRRLHVTTFLGLVNSITIPFSVQVLLSCRTYHMPGTMLNEYAQGIQRLMRQYMACGKHPINMCSTKGWETQIHRYRKGLPNIVEHIEEEYGWFFLWRIRESRKTV